ncbi:MAG TPA: hypothetical protein VK972_02410, partial [Wenzhouxiangella sp.]|nr:hypothetical protein [Wenzhouxiangella sp.]
PLEEVSFAEMVIELSSVARQFKLTLQPQLIMLQKTLLNIEGMGRELYPRINIWEVAKPELETIFAERYGLPRTMRRMAREMPAWLARAPELPGLVHGFLKTTGEGRLRTRIDSEDLQKLAAELSRHNRRLPGAILAAGLIISGAVLAGYQVAPLWQDYSLPAGVALLAGAILGWRAWRSR